MVNGRKSSRGRSTYLPCASLDVPPGRVQEVVFAGAVRIPYLDTASRYEGPWTRLR